MVELNLSYQDLYDWLEEAAFDVGNFWREILANSSDPQRAYDSGLQIAKLLVKIKDRFKELDHPNSEHNYKIYYYYGLFYKLIFNDEALF